MTNDGSTESSKQPHPEGSVPLILTAQQREEAEEKRKREADAEAARVHRENDEAYKKRQLDLMDAGNRQTAAYVRLTRTLAVLSFIGLLATFIQGWVAKRNADSTEIAAQAAQSAAKTADATLKEMKADAQKSLIASQEATDRDQRAWVGLSQLEAFRTDTGQIIRGSANNSGKTPANEVRAAVGVYVRFSAGFLYKPTKEDYDWFRYILKRTWNKEISQTTTLWQHMPINPPYEGRLPPHLTMRDFVGAPQIKGMGVLTPGNSPYDLPLSVPDLSPIHGDYLTVIVYGEILYKDFRGKDRSTQFCYLVQRPTSEGSPLIPCEKHNEMK